MIEKYRVHELVRLNYSDIGEYIDENHTDRPLRNDILVKLLNNQDKQIKELEKENEKLKNALKNSYLNEICENCKHGYYYMYNNQGLEGDFECKKGHDGADCDGLKDCDDFELEY